MVPRPTEPRPWAIVSRAAGGRATPMIATVVDGEVVAAGHGLALPARSPWSAREALPDCLRAADLCNANMLIHTSSAACAELRQPAAAAAAAAAA